MKAERATTAVKAVIVTTAVEGVEAGTYCQLVNNQYQKQQLRSNSHNFSKRINSSNNIGSRKTSNSLLTGENLKSEMVNKSSTTMAKE